MREFKQENILEIFGTPKYSAANFCFNKGFCML